MKKNKIKVLGIKYIEDKFARYDKEGNYSYSDYQLYLVFKVNGKKQHYRFITNKQNFIIAFLESPHLSPIPEDKETRRTILQLAYGELQKILAEYEVKQYFYNQDKQEEEERLRKEREEKAKKIALGEQISIEKYLKNI